MAFDFEKIKSLLKFSLKGDADSPMVGVDVGASSIKLVQLHLENDVPTLDTYGELQLGPYANLDIGQSVSLKPERLTEAFVDIIRESSITGSNAALSISYAASFATTFSVEAIDEEDIAKKVPIEARKYIPVALNEVTLDWFTLRQDEAAGRTEIFLVAIHNEALGGLQGVFANAGLTMAYTELEPFSAVRSVLSTGNPTAAVVDLGANATKLYIVRDGTMQYTHSIARGGVALTESITRAASLPFADAETKKRTLGLQTGGSDAIVGQTLRDSLSRTGKEIGKALSDYEKKAGIQLSSVVLLGGGASMPGITAYLQDILQRKVTVAAPFNKVAYPAFLEDALKEAGPSFAVAVGAALRQFTQ